MLRLDFLNLRYLAVAVLLHAWPVRVALTQNGTAPSPALAGLRTVRLNVAIDAHSSVSVPIDTARLMRGIESGLRANGWRLSEDSAAFPRFVLHAEVNEFTQKDGPSLYVIRYDYGLYETVKTRGQTMLARTWTGNTWTQIAIRVQQVAPLLYQETEKIVREFNAARGPIRDRSA